MKPGFSVLILLLLSFPLRSEESPFLGDWAFVLPDGHPAWLRIAEDAEGNLAGSLLWSVGSARPVKDIAISEDDTYLTFTKNTKWRPGRGTTVLKIARNPFRVTTGKGQLALHCQFENSDNPEDVESFTLQGKKLPPHPPRPDLSKVTFGAPISLIGKSDLSGWHLDDPTKKNGWRVENSILINDTPKTSFSAYGEYGNLVSDRTFEDFRLTIEYNVPTAGNSGIYLRGMYEAQVVDRDSKMQGISGPGAIFGRIAPSENAGKPGGEWNQYILTLVDRHVTVVLNGKKVIDNQRLEGCTGGGLSADDTLPGPIFLQGDHTNVKYRNIVVEPVVKR